MSLATDARAALAFRMDMVRAHGDETAAEVRRLQRERRRLRVQLAWLERATAERVAEVARG